MAASWGVRSLQLGLCLSLGCVPGSLAGPGNARDEFINRFPELVEPPDYNLLVAGSGQSPARSIGGITGIARLSDRQFEINCSRDSVRIEFFRADLVRIWLGWDGSFTDLASKDIVVGEPVASLNVSVEDVGNRYRMVTFSSGGAELLALEAFKSPLLFRLLWEGQVLWSEKAGLALNATATYQTLEMQDGEYFFGGGMQNGRFSHRGHRIRISTSFNWDDGGNPNAAPVFLSSLGYAAYRNTWSPGYYDFSESPAVLAHNESRFDGFFCGAAPGDFKALLECYTFLTGRPFMPPVYAMGLGDSDCYHNDRHGNDTRTVLAVASKYRELDIPASWFLPNDGYGCGFGVGPSKFPTDFVLLDEVVARLHGKGFQTGLWSSTGLPNISREVAGSGTRIAKTDVGWVGGGYKFAFDAVRMVAEGIENNSEARRFIWTVEGWAGTQRYAVMWTGDDSGSFEYIRFQIPTFVGAGFSGQAHVSGDVDGIFGGSPESYVRDLQLKCLTTTIMVMSGWAANPDKQPWTWGEPYTSINRLYLKLKAQLTPYFYTLSREAHDTGVPPLRAMVMEFPWDSSLRSNNTGSAMQFMSGPSLLVAPVYRPLSEGGDKRDGIYLPAALWVDYWTGEVTIGGKVLGSYSAPLERLPLFVRAGAIIPMWPAMAYPGEQAPDPLTLDVYPELSSSFRLYEDDGVTRQALTSDGRGGAFAWTEITCSSPDNLALLHGGDVNVTVGASDGEFVGKLSQRRWVIQVHLPKPPQSVRLQVGREGGPEELPHLQSRSALDFALQGWTFSKAVRGGVVYVKTRPLNTSKPFFVELLRQATAEGRAEGLPGSDEPGRRADSRVLV